MDDLFLRDKTPVFTEAVIPAIETKFGIEVFTRTTILPKKKSNCNYRDQFHRSSCSASDLHLGGHVMTMSHYRLRA